MKERGYRRGLAAFLIPLGALVGVGALLLLFWGAASLWSFFHTDSQVYRENWGLALPQEVEQEYSALSPDRAMGDGWRYTVFQAGEAAPYLRTCARGGTSQRRSCGTGRRVRRRQRSGSLILTAAGAGPKARRMAAPCGCSTTLGWREPIFSA